MKKLLYLMLAFVFVFTACSSDESDEESTNANTFNPSEIIGVWSDDKFFVSFGSDGYYSAYIADDFISCGHYTISNAINGNDEYKADKYFGNTFGIDIVCSSYFSDLDIYLFISELTESTMKIAARYTIRYPYKSDYRSLTLTKTNNQPTIENHSYIGYSYSEKCTIDGYEANITTTLSAYNIGKMTTDHEEAGKFPITLHYIYLENTIYYQKKIPNRQLVGLPTWYGWNDDDTGTVSLHICN